MIAYECEPDQDAALVLLERALVVHPNNLNLLLAVGSRRMKAGRLEAAEQAYRAAVRLVPAQAGPWTGLAMAQALMNDRTAAAESCRTALRLEPDFAAARTFCEANELLRDAP